jgi:hypothetical protein
MTRPHGEERRGDLRATLALELKVLMSDVPVGSDFAVAPSSDLCFSLELLIPRMLRLDYPEWMRESLDGVFVARARRTAPAAAELVGTCILISDQAVTPFQVSLVLSPSGDTLESYRVRIGEPGNGPLGISGPDCNSPEAITLLANLISRLDRVTWSYEIAKREV